MRLRIIFDFDAAGAQTRAMAHLRGLLDGLQRHQDLGVRLGPSDLEDAGFDGARLISAQMDDAGDGYA